MTFTLESAVGVRTLRKVTWRLIPFMAVLYFLNYLDRVNVGFAALTMNDDLAFSATVYGNGAGILFLGYVLFQVPSNIALEKWGTRRWVTTIMVVWGIISSMMAFVSGQTSFYVLRFLLGVAEAGFFPGMILYMTYWFPSAVRARIAGAFMLAVPISGILGAPASTALLGIDWLGFKGWQWLFVLQGLPAIVLGFAVLGVLTDKPEKATWLTEEEKAWLTGLLGAEQRARAAAHNHSLREVLINPRTWIFGLMYFGIAIGFYGLTLWLPQIIKGFGGLTNMQVGFLTAAPYIFAAVGMYLWGAHSDKTGERTWHVALPCIVSGIGLSLSAILGDMPVLAFIALSVAAVGVYSALPTFWTLPTAVLSGTAAAGGIALINAIGNTGGYFGPALVGYIRDATGSYTDGLILLAGFAFLTAVLTLLMRTRPTAKT
jgi:ACS family tartrate transporter-like MFS transporter